MTDIRPRCRLLARYAIMVDVGYIYAAAGELLFSAASRREYRVDADKLIQALTRHADGLVRGELLRVYWYDAARDRVPTIDQRVIAQMARVKLRLGNLNARGQQKGVDAQIRADMEALARHRADHRRRAGGRRRGHGARGGGRAGLRRPGAPVGRRAAVRHQPGRAAGLGVGHGGGPGPGVPRAVLHQATPADPAAGRRGRSAAGRQVRAPLARAVVRRPAQARAAGPARRAHSRGPARAARPGWARTGERVEEAGEHVAQKWILTRGEDNIRDLLPGPILPPVIDKELLVEAEKELGLSLRPYQEAREWLRDAFWERVRRAVRHRERQVMPGERAGRALRVVSGRPTAEELAALTAVVLGPLPPASGPRRPRPRPATARSAWLDRAALTRARCGPGPGAWRRSACPA